MSIEKKSDIVFSLIAPAIRQDLYKTFYNSIKKTNIKFEIIFVGYNPPTEEMPANFKYIYTKVNPAQCFEIAARNAVGEYLLCVADDLLFPDKFLDRIYFYLSRLYMDKALVGNRVQENGVFCDRRLTFNRNCVNSPVIPLMPAFKREVWLKLGGIDRRFSAALCDLDMIIRFYEAGYTPFVMFDNWVNEIRSDKIISSLYKKTNRLGRYLNDKFWVKYNEVDKNWFVVKNRMEPVMSFSDIDILTVDQFLK